MEERLATAGPRPENVYEFIDPPWVLMDKDGCALKDSPRVDPGDVLLVVDEMKGCYQHLRVPSRLVKVIHARSGKTGFMNCGLLTW